MSRSSRTRRQSPEGPTAGDEGAAEAELAQLAETMPHLSAMVAAELHDSAEDPLGWCDSRAELEFTLDLLLDGHSRANR